MQRSIHLQYTTQTQRYVNYRIVNRMMKTNDTSFIPRSTKPLFIMSLVSKNEKTLFMHHIEEY